MSQTDNSNTKELRFRPHQYYFWSFLAHLYSDP
jgi:hypothetical protein